jgi:hypothetical protein
MQIKKKNFTSQDKPSLRLELKIYLFLLLTVIGNKKKAKSDPDVNLCDDLSMT